MQNVELSNVKEIQFVFENCECMKLPSEGVNSISYDDDNTKVILNKLANIVYNPFGCSDEDTTTFNHIKQYDDITDITLFLNDDSELKIPVSWYDDDNDYSYSQSNDFQYIKRNSDGTLDINIGKDSPFLKRYENYDLSDEEDLAECIHNVQKKLEELSVDLCKLTKNESFLANTK